ncbi:asparagine synthase (glutamine-hydrolyzing) [Brumicola blandensis]|uniref:asparagine synthase (glutamine-hydrolyzing) n=1 Tax=Brumicola blandensis TaxID=3075611 RepID=A0AAW8R2H0_9ALTE|nr:asparagine synthase (glutamine-hydrolyzing) [Alteromonas sp. W409]MDT0582629.1 asparagine synthase (glutamine-hydrolyzing) [Alteromonas sp. W409]
MCGIAGFSTKNYEQLNEPGLVRMGNAIAHRGPDAHGEYLDEQVGLCHRRLSILDLSDAGKQPMFSDDNSIVIVFNGEIYNFLELKEELVKQGVTFRSGTDTEVIIRLYEKYGTDCLNMLNGMFAFALWDTNTKKLLIARDRLGKKPLYYYTETAEYTEAAESQSSEGKNSFTKFAFASEIKALLTLPDVKKEIRLDAVHDFFAYQYIPDPKSIFQHVHKLPPAHYMVIENNQFSIHKYWDLSFAQTNEDSEKENVERLRHLISETTKRRMISDVPLGAFLSGGVDSSGVVATMSSLSDTPVKTCTIAFDNKKYNEAEFAKSVAEQYKTDHHELLVHQNVADTLENIVSYFDEPFADPSLVPTFFVSELARQKVTVAIAGDGGDEVFAGYEKYAGDDLENKLRNRFPNWLRRGVFPSVSKLFSLVNISVFRRASNLLNSLSVSPAMGFYITNSFISDRDWKRLIKPEIKSELDTYHPSSVTLEKYAEADGNDHLSKILYTDMKTYLTGGILVKVDRMSMANSLEVRAPILDKEVIEFSASLPSNMKYRDKEKKYILKEAFKPFLSDDILYRKKMGFSVPLAQWFREEIKEIAQHYLIDELIGLKTVFKESQITTLWDEHLSGKKDHATVLWSMLMFEMWWQRYMHKNN